MKKSNPKSKIRILLSKPGLDGHSVGIRVIAQALRDQGFEVIFIGIRQKNETIINAAIQESVDAIGMSMLSGAHISIMEDFMSKLRKTEFRPLVVVGGVIPVEDHDRLLKLGVDAVFNTKDSFEDMADFIRDRVKTNIDAGG
ncbi:MAG: cobalamin-dependent protein [Deltaproteobacteria bacterium]|nr:cobalamin-dependent protein [Deltaproteobacteria bacterium]